MALKLSDDYFFLVLLIVGYSQEVTRCGPLGDDLSPLGLCHPYPGVCQVFYQWECPNYDYQCTDPDYPESLCCLDERDYRDHMIACIGV